MNNPTIPPRAWWNPKQKRTKPVSKLRQLQQKVFGAIPPRP